MANLKMTIDLGIYKSGFCIYDPESGEILHHGCLTAPNEEKTCQDLFAIASSHKVSYVTVELSHRPEAVFIKMKKTIDELGEQHNITVSHCTAAEWRRTLHLYVKESSKTEVQLRQKYKELAFEFVEKKIPKEYKKNMSDDEAEAICIAFADMRGIRTHKTNKERRNLQAIKKKQFYKREQEDAYYEESTESRKLYL